MISSFVRALIATLKARPELALGKVALRASGDSGFSPTAAGSRFRLPSRFQTRRGPGAPVLSSFVFLDTTGRPFRFILNNSKATAANVYLMLYPKGPIKRALQDRPELKRQIWEFLNEICPQAMLGEGRVYGGGLHKLEPKELGNVQAEAIAELLPESAQPRREKQVELFEESLA